MNANLFNSNHQSRLITTFKYVDSLVSEAVARLDPPVARSPFANYAADATPVQHRVMSDFLVRLRDAMRRFSGDHGVGLPEPRVGAVWSVRVALAYAETAIEELRYRHMRGYGDMSGKAAEELDLLTTQL